MAYTSKEENIRKIITSYPDCFLIGGMALSIWAEIYNLLDSHYSGLTEDIDFLGTKHDAQLHVDKLKPIFGDNLKFSFANIENTQPPSVAIFKIDNFIKTHETITIDYVSYVFGYNTTLEMEKLKKRAIEVNLGNLTIKCMHPLDCLKSKIHNLAQLPNKKNKAGIYQCKIAKEVIQHTFIDLYNDNDNKNRKTTDRKILLPFAENIIRLAQHKDAIKVRYEYGIDILGCIPLSLMPQKFQAMRWKQAENYINNKYKKYCKKHKNNQKIDNNQINKNFKLK